MRTGHLAAAQGERSARCVGGLLITMQSLFVCEGMTVL